MGRAFTIEEFKKIYEDDKTENIHVSIGESPYVYDSNLKDSKKLEAYNALTEEDVYNLTDEVLSYLGLHREHLKRGFQVVNIRDSRILFLTIPKNQSISVRKCLKDEDNE